MGVATLFKLQSEMLSFLCASHVVLTFLERGNDQGIWSIPESEENLMASALNVFTTLTMKFHTLL